MICFVDYRISNTEKNTLRNLGFKTLLVPKETELYPAIDGHVDIQIAIIDNEKRLLVINPNLPVEFKNHLKEYNINYIEAANSLSNKYPNNIRLNAFITKEFLIHNLKYTDEEILNSCHNKKLINIKQGYSKCSILPIKEKVIITNDSGIHKKLCKENFDILLLPYGDIVLSDFEYGFIGGTGGMISNDTLAFFGSLDYYRYGNKVKEFLAKHNVKPLYLKEGKLIDRGSLFVL